MMTITTIGRVVRNFELKTSEKSGCVYANFSIAVNEGIGENQKTTFFDCVVFGADAERLVKAKAKKGSLLYVTGKFGTQEFTRKNDGTTGYSLKITVLAWSYIPGTNGQKDANGGNDTNGANDGNGTNDGGTQTQPQNQEDYQGESYDMIANLDDEDLPL